jgi:DNA-binding response OmpR family regulator
MPRDRILKVVAIDSDDLMLNAYKQGLTAKGYSVQTFSNSVAKTSNVPLIAVSTIKDATMLTDVFIFGATDYLVKPFDIDVLDIKIKRAIETVKKRTSTN